MALCTVFTWAQLPEQVEDALSPDAQELLEDLDAVMAESTLYTIEDWSARPWYRRAAATFLKLGAIWL